MLVVAAGAGRLVIGDRVGWPVDSDVLAIRVDRLMIGLSVGAALSVSGVLLQALLRNPLASPYVLGVSSGAALGVIVAWAGWLSVTGGLATHSAAMLGAGLTMLAVYLLAQKRGRVDPIGLILVGVIVNSINGAAIMFLNYLNPHGVRGDMVRWLMGHLDDGVTRSWIITIGVLTLLGTAIAARIGPAMDVASFGDDEAASLGVHLAGLRLVMLGVSGVLTAGSVVLAGPVGFVGLVCPHGVRLVMGPSHRWLVIGSALAGAATVVAADALIKLASVETGIGLMPLGVLTALIGGPIFLLLLRREIGRI